MTVRRMAGWLALLALLWSAWAPTIAIAFERAYAAPGRVWVEVCSSTGLVRIAVDTVDGLSGQARQGREGVAHRMPDCDWCNLHGGVAPVADLAPASLLPLTHERPFCGVCDAPSKTSFWHSKQARAPPTDINT